jgi:bacterioferritin-associated ferredoxin
MIRNCIDIHDECKYDFLRLTRSPPVYICLCHGITENQIRSCVADGARTLCDLSGELGVATQCGNCAESAREVLHQVLQAPVHAQAPCPPPVSNLAAAL